MAITNLKSKSQLVQEILNYIHSRFSIADKSRGQVLRDLIVEPPAEFLFENYVILKFLESAFSLSKLESYVVNEDLRNELAELLNSNITTIDSMITEVVELHANNFLINRNQGTKANGTVSFYMLTRPTVSTVIPAGVRLQVPNTNIIYATTAALTIPAFPDAGYYNFSRNVWEFKVLAESEGIGTVYNVPPNLITQIVSGQGIFYSVSNFVQMAGGTNVEDDRSLLGRVKMALAGNFQGTANSILSRVTRNAFISDARVAYLPTDANKVREGLSKIDVFVKSDATNNTIDTVNPYSVNPITLNETYVTCINSVTIDTNSYIIPSIFYDREIGIDGTSFVRFLDISENLTDTTYLRITGAIELSIKSKEVAVEFPDAVADSGVADSGRITITAIDSSGSSTDDTANWNFTSDNTVLKRTSMLGMNIIRLEVGIAPTTGDAVSIAYLYNRALKDALADVNSSANLFVGQDIQLFPAEQVGIYVDIRVQIDSAYGSVSKSNEAITKITEFITGLGLGAVINQTDIYDIVLDLAGVTDIDLSNMTLGIGTEDIPPTSRGDITLTSKQYPYLAYVNVDTTTNTIQN